MPNITDTQTLVTTKHPRISLLGLKRQIDQRLLKIANIAKTIKNIKKKQTHTNRIVSSRSVQFEKDTALHEIRNNSIKNIDKFVKNEDDIVQKKTTDRTAQYFNSPGRNKRQNNIQHNFMVEPKQTKNQFKIKRLDSWDHSQQKSPLNLSKLKETSQFDILFKGFNVTIGSN